MSVDRRSSVTVIATVLNEYRGLPAWLASLERQTRLPDECLIVDGGSQDGTWEMLNGWEPPFPVRLMQLPGVSISKGRNAALEAAMGDIVAVTDAGTIADPDWLDRLVGAIVQGDGVDVASGFFISASGSRWARTLGAATLPDARDVRPNRFLPSSRSVAFRRTWLDIGMRYPEWLDYCEDLVFDLQLKRAGARFRFVPNAIVTFEPRSSMQQFFSQYYRYARGDGKAGLFARRHAIRYTTYGLALAVLARRRSHELAIAAGLGVLYVARPSRRYWRRSRAANRAFGAALVELPLIPFHMLVGDIAKMAGYPAGLLWRARRWGFSALGRVGWWCVRSDGVRWRP